jgi:hypothetical protein
VAQPEAAIEVTIIDIAADFLINISTKLPKGAR